MLVLSRKHNEKLHIGNDIVITIVRVRGDSVRIGIQAPKEIHVMRSELIGTPPKQSDASQGASEKKPSQALKPTAEEGGKGTTDNGPLAAFLKVFPKVELATAS